MNFFPSDASRKTRRVGILRKDPPAAPDRTQASSIYACFPFVSESDPDVQYKTTIYTDGTAHCQCEGFRYRQTCKHEQLLRRPAKAVRV